MSETAVKTLGAAEFAALEPGSMTVVDVREPDEILAWPVEGALNAPMSGFPRGLGDVPRDKPVVVICGRGTFSEQVADVLADRGYDVSNLAGGTAALREYLGEMPEKTAPTTKPAMAKTEAKHAPDNPTLIDARGLHCPGPIVAVGDAVRAAADGASFTVLADEAAFASDIGAWAARTDNTLESLTVAEDGIITAHIRKTAGQTTNQPATSTADIPHDKTFIVFSGDLDKTIAAFIMANGAAAMGRKVTMFFTFWGLNVLRKPTRVQVAKSAVERMFGRMMPRGTRRLGLSRMNMLGAGSRMIRGIMQAKGIASVEELMADAQAHGVRLMACQMSMEVMGIHKEELIDGVELAGVSTFLGAGETSDMTLFI